MTSLDSGRMISALEIVPATESDVGSILELYSHLHPEDPPLDLTIAGFIWRQISATVGRAVLLAKAGEYVVGTADYQIVPNLTRGGRPFVIIENVVVHSMYRNNGVGAALLQRIYEYATDAGAYKVQLSVGLDGPIAFYENQGMHYDGSVMKLRLEASTPAETS